MKTKSVSLPEYFKVINPSYTIYKVIPNTGTRNFKSNQIAGVINKCYIKLLDRCRREDHKYFYTKPAKISYMIYCEKGKVEFYFIVPDFRKHLLKEKIISTWKKVTIEEGAQLPSFSINCTKYQMKYAKEDALSLNVNKANNELLSSTLNVVDLLEDTDKVAILYNFMPMGDYQQKGFRNNALETLQRFKENKPLDKDKSKYILWTLVRLLVGLATDLENALNDFVGNKQKETNLTDVLHHLIQQKEVHPSTNHKLYSEVVKTQIAILSESKDKLKEETNALSVAESFKVIDEDNKLIPERTRANIRPLDYNIHTDINIMSTEEIGANLVANPGKDLIERHHIEAINILEQSIPAELREGYISLGLNTCRGVTTEAYMSTDPKRINLGLTLLGPQGAGKTTFLKKYAKQAIQKGESIIVPDFIKNCELAETIKSITPAEKLIELDLTNPDHFQALVFNEAKNIKGLKGFQLLEAANILSQQTVALVDAVNRTGEPLSPKMRRYFTSACMIAYIQTSVSFKQVIQILEDYDIRKKLLGKVPSDMTELLDEEIRCLRELDEVDKNGNTGTKISKIDNILDRINLLREDIRLKYMFNKKADDNVDFAKAMDEGKVILIKMPEHKFPTKHVKNVLVTFFISKIWIASQFRGNKHINPPRAHCIIDEVFQAPTAEVILEDILTQARKFQLKFIFSCHYLSQIKISEALKASGSSYMLLNGSDKKNFKELEPELYPMTIDDLLNLKDYHSMNLIKLNSGYHSFISNLYDKEFDTNKKSL